MPTSIASQRKISPQRLRWTHLVAFLLCLARMMATSDVTTCGWNNGCELETLDNIIVQSPSPYPHDKDRRETYAFNSSEVESILITFDEENQTADNNDYLTFYYGTQELKLSGEASNFQDFIIKGNTFDFRFVSDSQNASGSVYFTATPQKFQVKDGNQCSTNSDCSQNSPYCNNTSGSQLCVSCSLYGTDSSYICSQIDSNKPICNTEGYCTADLSTQLQESKTLLKNASTLTLSSILQKTNQLSNQSFNDLPSQSSRQILSNLLSTLKSSVKSPNFTDFFSDFTQTLSKISQHVDHMIASSVDLTLQTVKTVCESEDVPSTVLAEDLTRLVTSVSDCVGGVKKFYVGDERETELEKIDELVVILGKMGLKSRGAGVTASVVSDNLAVTFSRRTSDDVSTVCSAKEQDRCVEFPDVIGKHVSHCPEGLVDVQYVEKNYNRYRHEGDLVLVDQTVSIELYCSKDGSVVDIDDLNGDIVFEVNSHQDLDIHQGAPCVYWSEEDDAWQSEGCQSANVDQSGVVSCACNHLTLFALNYSKDKTNNQNDGNSGGQKPQETKKEEDDDDDDKPNHQALIFFTAGFLAFVLTISGIMIYCLVCRKHKHSHHDHSHGPHHQQYEYDEANVDTDVRDQV